MCISYSRKVNVDLIDQLLTRTLTRVVFIATNKTHQTASPTATIMQLIAETQGATWMQHSALLQHEQHPVKNNNN
jgi:hypothetical protein